MEKLNEILTVLNANSKLNKAMAKEVEEYWNSGLGDIHVKPLPWFISPKKIRIAEEMGWKLIYIPALDLRGFQAPTTHESLDVKVAEFMTKIEEKYPLFHLEKRFWKYVSEGRIKSPQLFGTWILVKTKAEKASSDEWDSANKTIQKNRGELLWKLRLPGYLEVRMLSIAELILFKKGEKDLDIASEWTSSFYQSEDLFNTTVDAKGDIDAVFYSEAKFRPAIILK